MSKLRFDWIDGSTQKISINYSMASIPPNLTLLTTLLQHEIKNTYVLVGEGNAI
jgi:hypothetical protein